MGAIPAAALDPNITTLGEIPQPPLMGNVDPSKIDEIRRTVYVGNLNSQVTKKKPSGSSCLFFLLKNSVEVLFTYFKIYFY